MPYLWPLFRSKHKGRMKKQFFYNMEAVFKTYYGSLCYYASNYIEDPEIIQDLVQDLFVRMLEKPPVFEAPEHLRNYLYLSVRNACLNDLHRKLRKDQHIQYVKRTQPVSEIPSEEVLTAEVYRRLKEAVDQLPGECRKILYLSYFEGLDNECVANRLHLSVNTVRAQKMRGKKLLKEKLKHLLPLLFLFPELFC